MRKPAWLEQRLHEPDRTATAIDGCAGLCMRDLKTLNVEIEKPPLAACLNSELGNS